MKKPRNPDDVSPLVREMAGGMGAVVANLKSGGTIERYAARTMKVDLEPFTSRPGQCEGGEGGAGREPADAD